MYLSVVFGIEPPCAREPRLVSCERSPVRSQLPKQQLLYLHMGKLFQLGHTGKHRLCRSVGRLSRRPTECHTRLEDARVNEIAYSYLNIITRCLPFGSVSVPLRTNIKQDEWFPVSDPMGEVLKRLKLDENASQITSIRFLA